MGKGKWSKERECPGHGIAKPTGLGSSQGPWAGRPAETQALGKENHRAHLGGQGVDNPQHTTSPFLLLHGAPPSGDQPPSLPKGTAGAG